MVVLILIFTVLAIHTAIGIEHPGFHKAVSDKKAEWQYVGSHDCESGKRKDGTYAVASNGKVHFKQVNNDGTVDKVSCSKKE